MPEQKTFMQALDEWTERYVIEPLAEHRHAAHEVVKKAIREKVLESYRNGQSAAPRREFKPRARR